MKALTVYTIKAFFLLTFTASLFSLTAQDGLSDSHNMSIDVPTVALVDVEPASGSTIVLGPVAPSEAGQPLQFGGGINNGMWLNYSSIKSTSTNPTRDITVEISSGPLPSGVDLQVIASSYSGNGDGDHGISTGNISLSTAPQILITDIGSCYTGDGVNNGHNLTYTLDLASTNGSYASLDADNSNTISITYTISDN